jgi:predicted amidohydrolase YtcJ
VAFGSDFPVEPPEPLSGFHAAVTRQDREGQPPGRWRPEQRVTRAQALAGFTAWAAWAGHADTRVGRLAPGLWADFVLLDGDPMAAPEGDIWRIGVVETWVGGRRVFQRDMAEAAPAAASGEGGRERPRAAQPIP